MIVHIDKLIRHLRSQIETAEQMRSEFVYLTKLEAEGCLELAEAQDVIQEIMKEKDHLVRCKDCKWWHESETHKGYGDCGQANGIDIYRKEKNGYSPAQEYCNVAEEALALLKEQDELLKHEYWRGYNNGRADERGLQEGTIMQTFSPD